MTRKSNSSAEGNGSQKQVDGVSRRGYLSGVAACAGIFAGCISNSGGSSGSQGLSDSDVPEFAVDESAGASPIVLAAAIAGKTESVEFLDEFRVEIAVGNAGSDTIDGESIDVGMAYVEDDRGFGETVMDPSPSSIELPKIGSGNWRTVTAELRVNAGGEWELETDASEHQDFELGLTVERKRLQPGESVATDVGMFEITALEPRFERALHYDTEEGGVGLFEEDATGLLKAKEDHILVLHRFEVDSYSDDISTGFGQVFADNQFMQASVSGEPVQPIDSDQMRDSIMTLEFGEGAESFGRNLIEPGETQELVVVQEVKEEQAEQATVTISFWEDTEDLTLDSVQQAPPLPAFDLVNATLDSQSGEDPIIEVTIENTGSAAGTFRGAGQFEDSRPTASDWVFLPEGVELTLGAGDRGTDSIVASRGSNKFRIEPFEEELTQ